MVDDRAEYSQQRLSFSQAGTVPCVGCAATCCTFLPLHDFQISRYQELDYALYLLNFDRIELAWMEGGTWRAHYRMPCGNLDLQTRRCTVHGTSAQPHVCRRYDPYNCFYKRLFQSPNAANFIRMDRGRMAAFAEFLVFDGHREIVGWPDREAVLAYLPPLASAEDDPPAPASTMLAQWEHAARNQSMLPGRQVRGFQDFDRPCEGCAAWCCTRLIFPHSTPLSAANLDYIRFCLGFPGVEVVINQENSWSLAIRTTCRHLVREEGGAGRCGRFGQADRPRICGMYDASMCGYKQQFGHPRPERSLRVRASEFEAMVGLFQFDEDGYILYRPEYPVIRQAIEQRWAEAGPAPLPGER